MSLDSVIDLRFIVAALPDRSGSTGELLMWTHPNATARITRPQLVCAFVFE